MSPTDRLDSANDHAVADLLASVHLAPRQAHKALTIWPLLRRPGAPPAPDCISLSEALESGACVLDEVSEHGAVPHARLDNHGEKAVLVIFGEELLGAKQNRIANASFLVAPATSVVLDVSCVEHGRWSRPANARFRAGEQIVSHKIRQKMQAKVAFSVASSGRFDADQHEVWEQVAKRVEGAQAESRSGAYQDYTRKRTTDLAQVLDSFHTVEDQVGFVAAIGDEVVGLEAVASPALLRSLFPKLLRGYAIDAIDAALAAGKASILSINDHDGRTVMRIIGGLNGSLRNDFLHGLTRVGVADSAIAPGPPVSDGSTEGRSIAGDGRGRSGVNRGGGSSGAESPIPIAAATPSAVPCTA